MMLLSPLRYYEQATTRIPLRVLVLVFVFTILVIEFIRVRSFPDRMRTGTSTADWRRLLRYSYSY
eukprot:scaffold132173_cov18-Prasinocladus_malaysianus.AAC.2